MAYYYEGRDGASFTDATLHHREDCDELGEPVRPIAEKSVEGMDDPDLCPECAPLDSGSESDTGGDDGEEQSIGDMIEDGVCPWCDDDPYEGDHVGRHASSAHPETWDDYRED